MKTLNRKSRLSFSKELKQFNYQEIIGSEILKSEAECKERLELLVAKGAHIRYVFKIPFLNIF